MIKASLGRIGALALRIFRQFTRDRRTAFLIFAAPIIIMTLLSYLLGGQASKIPFGLALDSDESSMVFDVIKHALEEEPRLKLVEIKADRVMDGLREGEIQGALVVRGGSFTEMMEGKGASIEVVLEGSDAIAMAEVAAIVARMQGRLMPALKDAISLFGDESAQALAQMEIKVDYLYGGEDFTETDFVAPIILAVFAFVLTFLLTSVSFLRERSSGTMERLLVSPITRMEVILGYMGGFLIFTLLQAGIILAFLVWILKINYVGNLALIFGVVALVTLVASNLGIFLSSFAKTELQVAQFMPIVIFPLILVSGVLWSVESMPYWLKPLAYASPLTWANVALRDVMIKGFGAAQIVKPVLILIGFAILFSILGAATLRKQSL